MYSPRLLTRMRMTRFVSSYDLKTCPRMPARQKRSLSLCNILKRRIRQEWNQEDIDRAHQLQNEGMGFKAIGQMLGRLENSVRERLKLEHAQILAGSRRTTWSAKDIEKVKELRKQGTPLRRIAEIMGKTYDAVARISRSSGLHSRRSTNGRKQGPTRPWQREEHQLLLDLQAQGKRPVEIAQRLDRSVSSVRSHIARGNAPRTMFYTDEEKVILKSYLERGESFKAIQAVLPSRSIKSLREQAVKMGCYIRRPKAPDCLTKEENAILDSHLKRGDSIEAIRLALPRHSIKVLRKRIRDLGFANPFKWRPWTEHDIATLKTLLAEGLTFAEIAKELPGRTPWACRLAVARHLSQQHSHYENR